MTGLGPSLGSGKLAVAHRRMQQEWEQNRPSPTSGEKAMVPSTGVSQVGTDSSSQRHTGAGSIQFARNSRVPMDRGTLHAGGVQQPLSPLPGICQGQSSCIVLRTVLKGHKTPSLSLGLWLGMCMALAPTRSSPVPVPPPHFLTCRPPKVCYIYTPW